jgi:hypothetical protein
LVLVTIFYCLRFETSLFVASYDSQGHGEGIRSRLHTGSLSPLSVALYKLRADSTENPVVLFVSSDCTETSHAFVIVACRPITAELRSDA